MYDVLTYSRTGGCATSAEFCGPDGFGLGAASGGSGYGIWLSADLSHGTTAPSPTYSSPCLVDGGDSQREFQVMASSKCSVLARVHATTCTCSLETLHAGNLLMPSCILPELAHVFLPLGCRVVGIRLRRYSGQKCWGRHRAKSLAGLPVDLDAADHDCASRRSVSATRQNVQRLFEFSTVRKE